MGFFDNLFYSDHSKYSEYSDEHMYRKWDQIALPMNAKIDECNAIRQRINKNYNEVNRHYEENINQLRREKNYSAFNYSSPANLLTNIKEEMRRELNEELRRENEELAAIDNMIAKINRITLESTR